MSKEKITQIDIDLMGRAAKVPSELVYRVVIHRKFGVNVAVITPKSSVRLHKWLLKNNYEMGTPQATGIWFFIPYYRNAKEIK